MTTSSSTPVTSHEAMMTSLVLLLVGGFLVRRYIHNSKAQLIAFIVAVLAIILGVNAGLT